MSAERVRALLDEIGATSVDDSPVRLSGDDPVIPTPYPVGTTAATALGGLAAVLTDLAAGRGGRSPAGSIDVRHAAASLMSLWLLRRDGELVSPLPSDGNPTTMSDGNPLVALYEAADGRWVHVHGAFAHLADATREVLEVGPAARPDDVAAAVAGWESVALEDALAAAGTCGAVARTGAEWRAHPHGSRIAAQPIVSIRRIGDAPARPLAPGGPGTAALTGVRVLDATRILAGPVCGRTLGEHGADVLLVTSPGLGEFDQSVMDTGHGKRSAFLDLSTAAGVAAFHMLAADADVIVDSYRGGSFERRGLGAEALAERHPGIVCVAISCYGSSGPWAGRPGWEHMAQTACGLAVGHGGSARPQLMPVAFCDYVTGFLGALGAAEALRRRAIEGGSWSVEVSLARTATWLEGFGAVHDPSSAVGVAGIGRFVTGPSPFGELRAIEPALTPTTPWQRMAVPLGTDAPTWG